RADDGRLGRQRSAGRDPVHDLPALPYWRPHGRGRQRM
ncbi:MAG: Maltodextrin ABC transporter, permease protein MdxG, partial [uncultured Rubrobacteraceae bacterium]